MIKKGKNRDQRNAEAQLYYMDDIVYCYYHIRLFPADGKYFLTGKTVRN